MQIIKSTALVLGFLFGLSTAYYLSFWSHFDIDVFQYMAVEDIIKGVAYPLRFVGLWLIGLSILVVVTLAVIDVTKDPMPSKKTKRILWAFIGYAIITTVFYLLIYLDKIPGDKDLASIGCSFIFSFFFAFIYWLTDYMHEQKKKTALQNQQTYEKQRPIVYITDSLVIFLLILFPISAIISGQTNAKKILNSEQYDYIMTRDLPKDTVRMTQAYLVFLGAIGEKYIFTDTKQQERFIIDKEELKIMRIHHFDKLEPHSVEYFNDLLAIKKIQECKK